MCGVELFGGTRKSATGAQLRGEENAKCEAVQKVARAEQTADRTQREPGGLFEELGDVLRADR